MFEKMLDEKSTVSLEKGRWDICPEFSSYNKPGLKGRDDLIKRQDAVRLLGEMNIKLIKTYDAAKEKNPNIAEELLQATEILSYAIWGIRELDAAENLQNTDIVSDIIPAVRDTRYTIEESVT